MTLRILVVGAGIAGLAAARGLRVAGFRPDVVEELPATMSPGAGIYLPGNATRALRLLGLDAPLRPARRPDLPAGLPGLRRTRAVRDGRRRALGRRRRVPGAAPRRPAAGAAHRGRRRGPLRHRGHATCRSSTAPPRSSSATAPSREYDLVIGADGRRSTIRAKAGLGGPATPDRADRLPQRGQRRPGDQRLDRPARAQVGVRGDADGRPAAVLLRRRDGRPGRAQPGRPAGPGPGAVRRLRRPGAGHPRRDGEGAGRPDRRGGAGQLVHGPGAAGRRRRPRHRADPGPGRRDVVRGRRRARRGAAGHARRHPGRSAPPTRTAAGRAAGRCGTAPASGIGPATCRPRCGTLCSDERGQRIFSDQYRGLAEPL